MIPRAILLLLAAFWLTMNALLWRAEYGQVRSTGSPVPTTVVWRKILTAPDSSSLTILHHGERVGFCQWVTSVGEALSKLQDEEATPDAAVEHLTGYHVRIDGNLVLSQLPQKARFEANLKLSPKRRWQEVHARLNLGSAVWDLHSTVADQILRIKGDDPNLQFERAFTFAELRNPERLLEEFAGPFASGVLRGLGWSSGATSNAMTNLGLEWQAHEVTTRIGRATVRAYRLDTVVLERYRAVILVSRVGELLRAELPDEYVLVNDQLANF